MAKPTKDTKVLTRATPLTGLTDSQIRRGTKEMICRHVVQLSEYVSTVQIIATKLEPDGTTTRFSYGMGDVYARAKAAECFLAGLAAGNGNEED